MTDNLRKHMLKYLEKGIRYDGRKLDEYRNIELSYAVSETAEGSATVKIGETEAVVGVKLSIGTPYPDMPEDGSLMVGAELLPLSSSDFEAGPPSIQAVEIARVTDRCIRESKSIDTRKLCIKKGEKVWSVSIDLCTINDAGNLFDASSITALAALKDTRFPVYNEETNAIDYRQKTDARLMLTKLPLSVTVIKIGKFLLVDPTIAEEKILDARLTVASTDDGTLCALQKGGSEALTTDDIQQMVNLGIEKAAELRRRLFKEFM